MMYRIDKNEYDELVKSVLELAQVAMEAKAKVVGLKAEVAALKTERDNYKEMVNNIILSRTNGPMDRDRIF